MKPWYVALMHYPNGEQVALQAIYLRPRNLEVYLEERRSRSGLGYQIFRVELDPPSITEIASVPRKDATP
jgi:hypothetical protein